MKELERLFGKEIIVVKAYSKSEDMTGHIDGMMRFVNENTLIGNSLEGNYQYIKDDVQRLKRDYGLDYIELPYFEDLYNNDMNVPVAKRISARGIYVNYLEIGQIILFPIFQMDGFKQHDENALKIISETFPNKRIIPININDITKEGGLMNCISWCAHI